MINTVVLDSPLQSHSRVSSTIRSFTLFSLKRTVNYRDFLENTIDMRNICLQLKIMEFSVFFLSQLLLHAMSIGDIIIYIIGLTR